MFAGLPSDVMSSLDSVTEPVLPTPYCDFTPVTCTERRAYSGETGLLFWK